jgi:hypothetical protein
MVEHPDPAWKPALDPKASDPYVAEVLSALKKVPSGGCQ